MPRNRLPWVMKYYSPTGRRNHGRPLKRLLDTWDRNRSTSGPTPLQIYDDDQYNTKYVDICEDLKMSEVYWCYHVIDSFIDLCVVLDLFWQLLKISKTWIRNFSEQCKVRVNNFWFIIYFFAFKSYKIRHHPTYKMGPSASPALFWPVQKPKADPHHSVTLLFSRVKFR